VPFRAHSGCGLRAPWTGRPCGEGREESSYENPSMAPARFMHGGDSLSVVRPVRPKGCPKWFPSKRLGKSNLPPPSVASLWHARRKVW
jgi:hypothetical protein